MLNKTDPVGFDTVLVANRGEIAVRVIRTLREMGIRSVAVYSDADVDARHVHEADVAIRLGPAPARESYLDIAKVVDAAVRTGARAVHPGYGFLSENAAFAAALAEKDIVFLGPPAKAIEVMGDKITAKNTVSAFDVPVVPGIAEPGLDDTALIAAATAIGYPVLVKPSAGGGGKGMRLVEDPAGLPAALASARREAGAAFGDDTLFLERFVTRPRHIEVQILADQHGNVVHLGERECSLQRRHQKVIEEAPSPLLDAATRARIGTAACNTARSVDYVGAGTVEFIVSADRPDEFFFMEMNTRLQVEHPVTEMVTGVDLVECQVRVAAGQRITLAQEDIRLIGHAVEARVYAEDPGRGFLPTGGTVVDLAEPSGNGVRVDSGLRVGTVVGSDYDPMLSKVIAHGPDRAAALTALDRALADTAVLGVTTNIEFLRFLLEDPDVVAGRLDTALLDRRAVGFTPAPVTDDAFAAAAVYHWLRRWPTAPGDPWQQPTGWRVGDTAPTSIRLGGGERTEHVFLTGTPAAAELRVGDDGSPVTLSAALLAPGLLTITVDGLRRDYRVAEHEHRLWVGGPLGVTSLREVAEVNVRAGDADSGDTEIRSPMPGSVISVPVESGAEVAAGAPVIVVEAMKMEHSLTAPAAGTVELLVEPGDQVSLDQVLARIHSAPAATPESAVAAENADMPAGLGADR
ncbi:acetyl/propionyl/methylcrotonyl-CoA carboxylase subunit alpha [Nocardia cyriacigeorgica]|uniref:acetyl-CoA carboxylase biotin carboxylase subunit n=1 Tax=Nocardia cyriacigeorgica TaxID=135487 RepID=UPI0013BBA274|nr:acetyl/propionyl/methylcrotonyl-CoA carboxylase subunit alpha [Nocardia cyriacigeorgica]NEW52248.1 acetyl/propionyl/methylcrotonyl-CoA carboxylase subunit alpha [Nocardia cyriacigeorgica]